MHRDVDPGRRSPGRGAAVYWPSGDPLGGRCRKDDQGEDLAPRDVEAIGLRDEVDPPVLE
jgi:hypothetical protein